MILPFLIFFVLSGSIFFFSQRGLLQNLSAFSEQMILPVQRFGFTIFPKQQVTSEEKLRVENARLLTQLTRQQEIEKENKALRDQFETANPAPQHVVPAKVIGQEEDGVLIFDKGEHDGIKKGQIVVVKNNLVGIVDLVSAYRCRVLLITNKKVSFTAQTTMARSQGIVHGNGGEEIVFDKVVLSDKLENEAVVVTKGDMSVSGEGLPPGLIVGKIVSIKRQASNLFQSAEVMSFVDFEKLEIGFIVQ